jgi:hypothetical protein
MASVIERHIPEPPPVQNSTLPLNKSGLNTSEERMILAENGADMVEGKA